MNGHAPFILVVDEDVTMRLALCLMLHDAGYIVWLAANGQEALDFLNTVPVDLVISNLKMQKANGCRLMVHVRAHPQWKALPFIVMTQCTAHYCPALGPASLLQQPFIPADLLALINRTLHPA